MVEIKVSIARGIQTAPSHYHLHHRLLSLNPTKALFLAHLDSDTITSTSKTSVYQPSISTSWVTSSSTHLSKCRLTHHGGADTSHGGRELWTHQARWLLYGTGSSLLLHCSLSSSIPSSSTSHLWLWLEDQENPLRLAWAGICSWVLLSRSFVHLLISFTCYMSCSSFELPLLHPAQGCLAEGSLSLTGERLLGGTFVLALSSLILLLLFPFLRYDTKIFLLVPLHYL